MVNTENNNTLVLSEIIPYVDSQAGIIESAALTEDEASNKPTEPTEL